MVRCKDYRGVLFGSYNMLRRDNPWISNERSGVTHESGRFTENECKSLCMYINVADVLLLY